MPPAKRATKTTAKKAAKKATPTKRRGPRAMSAAHKSALAEGREQSRIVDRYLRAVTQPKPRGRKVSKAALFERLGNAEKRARAATGVERLTAAQEVRDLRVRIAAVDSGDAVDVAALEKAFVKVAKNFSEKRGISYGAWRDTGVSAEVLAKAGIKRSRG
jgi:hypothetical protein